VSLDTEAQRRQIIRTGTAGGGITTDDRYAIAGIYLQTTQWSEDLRRQIARALPVVDASIGEADRYNLAHTYRSEQATGPMIEIFDVTWSINPTLTGTLLPSSVDGTVVAILQGASMDIVGVYVDPPLAVSDSTVPEFTAGFAHESSFYSDQYRKDEKRRRLVELLQYEYDQSEG